MPSFKDLTGKRFGKLVVVEKAERPKNMVVKVHIGAAYVIVGMRGLFM